jgi:hypothetical protein
VTLIEALKRITAAAEDNPFLREAIVALVDTAAERVMDEVKDDSPQEGFDEGLWRWQQQLRRTWVSVPLSVQQSKIVPTCCKGWELSGMGLGGRALK